MHWKIAKPTGAKTEPGKRPVQEDGQVSWPVDLLETVTAGEQPQEIVLVPWESSPARQMHLTWE